MDPVTLQLYISLAVQAIDAGKKMWDILRRDNLTDDEINQIEQAANEESARRKTEREAMGKPSGGNGG